MALEGYLRQEGMCLDYTPAAAVTGGEVIQLRDGRCGVAPRDIASGVVGALQVHGVYRLLKTASIVILSGGKVWWDHSANAATFRPVNDRDFYCGVAVADAAASDAYVDVAINVEPRYIADIMRDPATCVTVGTVAAGGFDRPRRIGGAEKFVLSATNEAQKSDLLSRYGFAPGAKAIIEMEINNVTNGSGGSQDLSVGVANATHASDADAITDSIFVHMNGNDLNIYAECDDGTNETNATDTTIDAVAGTPFEVWIDCRDLTSIKFYINGVRVLSGTTFSVAAATNTYYLLAHLEKSSSTDTFDVDINFLRARIAQN